MAGVSTKEIKTRIRSMESTKQITKAMEMVAASKLRRAQNQVLCSRPYFEILYATMNDIVDSTRDFSSPYLTKRPVKKSVYVVIAGDRGLAGGYNSNILKLVAAEAEGKDVLILPIGKKAADHFRARGAALLSEKYADAEDVGVGDCFTLAKWLCRGYLNGEYDEIKVAYTNCSCSRCFARRPAGRGKFLPIFSTSRTAPPCLTPSSRNIWAAFSTGPCARAGLPSRRPAGRPWNPPPRTQRI